MTTITQEVGLMQDKLEKDPVVNGTCKENDSTPSWLDKEFVQEILRRDAENDAITVVDIAVKRAVPVGDNYASLLLRVDIEYRDDKELRHHSLIVKSLPVGEIMRKWIEEMAIFIREAHMYQVTLPAIYRLVQERTGAPCEPLATKVFAHDRPETIVLEDLKPLGYKMADRRQGLDLKHCVQALKTLARLHGLSVALHAHDPTAMDFCYEKMFTEESRKMQTDMMTAIFNNLATEVKSWPGFERFEPKLQQMTNDCVDRIIELVKTKPGGIRVLNHGDFWTNNMLFRYDKEGTVEDVKMVDFQMVRFASPALDLIYFMYTSSSQQVLEDHMQEMVQEYHKALCETMRQAGCDQDLFITLDQLLQEMQDKVYFSVFISSMFSIMVAEPEDAPDFTKITEEDMESGNVDTMNKAFAGKRFREAFQRRLLKFEADGLI